MTDSIKVFPPDFRVLDGNGDPVSGAKIKFFDEGTSNPKTVHSDYSLTTSLGSTVHCDSEGAPVNTEGGSTKVEVYVNASRYKVTITDSDDVTIESKDNVDGALDTTGYTAATYALAKANVLAKSADYTVTTDDQGKVVNMDATSADRTITLPSAVTAGDGYVITLRHVGTAIAYTVAIATVSSQTISVPLAGGAATSFTLTSYGESVTLVSDGANWHCMSHVLGLGLGQGHHQPDPYDLGTVSSGSITVDPENGLYQKVTINGAVSWLAPSQNCDVKVLVTNGASAGTQTVSDFDKESGDSHTTGNGDKFYFNIANLDGSSRIFIEAMQ